MKAMKQYLKRTDNASYRTLSKETFSGVLQRRCRLNLKCDNEDCTSEEIAIRDHRVVGTNCKELRDEADDMRK